MKTSQKFQIKKSHLEKVKTKIVSLNKIEAKIHRTKLTHIHKKKMMMPTQTVKMMVNTKDNKPMIC